MNELIHISYDRQYIVGPRWANWITKVNFDKWQIRAMRLTGVFFIFFSIWMMSYSAVRIASGDIEGVAILVFVVLASLTLYWLYWPFFESLKRGIIQCNWGGSLEQETLLTFTKKQIGMGGAEFRFLQIKGICSLCGGAVKVKDGGNEFHRKLIGRCLSNPDLHYYSFNFQEMTGVLLQETDKKYIT